VPGALLFRAESALVYFNAEHVATTVLERARAEGDGLRLVVCDLSTSPYVDIAGARMLATLHDELAKRDATLRVAEAHAGVRDLLRAEGLEEKFGRIDRLTTVADVIDGFAHAPEHRPRDGEA
jgi:MFS superfamily sulfate permease-like transporter